LSKELEKSEVDTFIEELEELLKIMDNIKPRREHYKKFDFAPHEEQCTVSFLDSSNNHL